PPRLSYFRFSFQRPPAPPALHSFPTRRSSDLPTADAWWPPATRALRHAGLLSPAGHRAFHHRLPGARLSPLPGAQAARDLRLRRSEEHTSELQSRFDLVCRLLLEKKKDLLAHG